MVEAHISDLIESATLARKSFPACSTCRVVRITTIESVAESLRPRCHPEPEGYACRANSREETQVADGNGSTMISDHGGDLWLRTATTFPRNG